MKNCIKFNDETETSDQIDDYFFDEGKVLIGTNKLNFSKKRHNITQEALLKLVNNDLKGLDQKLIKGIFSGNKSDLG
jgi:hypothetical protein